ncbi:MAG: 4Fe-4S double cluster binding domain-containing protein [Bacillota bacterium]
MAGKRAGLQQAAAFEEEVAREVVLVAHERPSRWRLVNEDGPPDGSAEPLPRSDYPPARRDPCGNCRLCIDNCPTGALVGPFVLDPTRCIDRNTWRAGEWLPRRVGSKLGTRVYGCDACQEVCPFNKRALTAAPAQSEGEGARFDLAPLASSGNEEYVASVGEVLRL